MTRLVYFQVLHNDDVLSEGNAVAPFDVGRQLINETAGFGMRESESGRRLVIAPLVATSIPRNALRVEHDGGDKLHVRNVHTKIEAICSSGKRLFPNQSLLLLDEECVVFSDDYRVKFSPKPFAIPNQSLDAKQGSTSLNFRTLDSRTVMFGHEASAPLLSLLDSDRAIGAGRTTVELVRAVLGVFKEQPGTDAFFDTVVRVVLEVIDVDRALVLVRAGEQFEVRASSTVAGSTTAAALPMHFSRSLVQKVCEENKTVFFEPSTGAEAFSASMVSLERAVASPIFNDEQQVIAILYGDKQAGRVANDRPIGDLEATLLEVLASAVSNSLLRQRDQEFRTSAAQFFSPRVLGRLSNQKELLGGQDTQVTVLFCDVRGFSTVTERAGPAATIEWINDVLTVLSECVLKHDGVLVDYVGDELMAMWGAPENQPDHAHRACRAAREMLQSIPALNDRWRELVADKFSVGIGVSTGLARVGNTGSRIKFKYGPLGNTVNLASRVQGVTKQIGAAGLITGSTAQAIDAEFLTRRLTAVRVVGIHEPVQLYQLMAENEPDEVTLCQRYGDALRAFEEQRFTDAARLLANLVNDYPSDRPSIMLLSRTAACLHTSQGSFEAVWTLQQK